MILALIGVLPVWSRSHAWGHVPSALSGLIALIPLIWIVLRFTGPL